MFVWKGQPLIFRNTWKVFVPSRTGHNLFVREPWKTFISSRRLSLPAAPTHKALKGQTRPVPLVFFSDANFRLLRDQFVASAAGKGFQLCESYVENLSVDPHRAGGGQNVYEFKTRLLVDSLKSIDAGSFLVISDVDLQFFSDTIIERIHESMADRDACFQREFVELGVNIGFMALRQTSRCVAFWQEVERQVLSKRGFDQRIVNDLLYGGLAERLGLRWGRFPIQIWASSQALSDNGVPLHDILLHHANWVRRNEPTWSADSPNRGGAANPGPKLSQLSELRDLVARQDRVGMANFASRFASDPALAKYHRKSVGDLRRGPEWIALPGGHVARLGFASDRS